MNGKRAVSSHFLKGDFVHITTGHEPILGLDWGHLLTEVILLNCNTSNLTVDVPSMTVELVQICSANVRTALADQMKEDTPRNVVPAEDGPPEMVKGVAPWPAICNRSSVAEV